MTQLLMLLGVLSIYLIYKIITDIIYAVRLDKTNELWQQEKDVLDERIKNLAQQIKKEQQ